MDDAALTVSLGGIAELKPTLATELGKKIEQLSPEKQILLQQRLRQARSAELLSRSPAAVRKTLVSCHLASSNCGL